MNILIKGRSGGSLGSIRGRLGVGQGSIWEQSGDIFTYVSDLWGSSFGIFAYIMLHVNRYLQHAQVRVANGMNHQQAVAFV